MNLTYETYPFSPILGWSSSRYETFDKCKRQYYYTYYQNYIKDVPSYKLAILKSLTSIPLEIGNIIHDVIEAFLRRLQKSTSDIDEKRFYNYAISKAKVNFSQKTFCEVYYKQIDAIDMEEVNRRITKCLNNFLSSPVYHWIFMKAITNSTNWMIEPNGYGETRINKLKAYCKMDFLFPVDDHIYILDWKTGKRDTYKHSNQLIAYAVAASNNFHVPWNIIFPKIVYLFPEFDEFEITLKENDCNVFFEKVLQQTQQMYEYCIDVEKNIPRSIDSFPQTPIQSLCRYCNYQELCFPESVRKEISENNQDLF